MAHPVVDLSRLKAILQNSGLSQKNQPLHQVIWSLIDFCQKSLGNLSVSVNSSSGGGGGGGGSSTLVNGTTAPIELDFDCYPEPAFPGPKGDQGPQGIQGIPGLDGICECDEVNITPLIPTFLAVDGIPITLVNSANPTGTTSLTAVMMGLGGTAPNAVYTPYRTGRLVVYGFATLSNNTANDGITCGMRSGTGAAPANGAAVTGTQRGATRTFTAPIANGNSFAVMISVFFATPGTQIWLDMAINAITGGTASITQVSFLIFEL